MTALSTITAAPQAAFDALHAQLDGALVLPGAPGYDADRTPWLRVVDQYPALIVEAASLADITRALAFARAHQLPLAVQATGHGIARPCNGGLLLHLAKLKTICLDLAARTVRVGAGVSWKELLAETQPHGLVAPSGQVSSVGVVGYLLGGGIGWLVRKYGMGCADVLAATVVTAAGAVVRASPTEQPDLFWALRGGGGNFGVVAEIELRLRAEPDDVLAGLRWFPLSQAATLLPAYRDWAAGLAAATSTVFRFDSVPDKPSFPAALRGKVACVVGLCHADRATADQVRASLQVFGEPALDQVKFMSYSAVADLDPASHEPSAQTYGQGAYLRDLSEATIQRLLAVAKSKMPPLFLVELLQLGGVLIPSAAGPDEPAFHTSAAPFMLHIVTPTAKSSWAELAQATDETLALLAPSLTGERYYNYLRGDEQPHVATAFTASAWARLRALKRQLDPENLFCLNLNIKPAAV